MELQKLVNINLDEEPRSKQFSSKNILFYNLDKNTAKFQFEVTNHDKPLLVSDKNVKGYAFCVSSNSSTSGVIDLDFIDPMKGIVGFTVPNFFLKSATNTECAGEIYLSLNDVNNTGKDDTVVLGRFGFQVGDALVNKVESDIKVEYIRMFDDLKATIENKVAQLETDVADINNIVSGVEQKGSDAVASINKASTDAQSAIEENKDSAISAIDTERDNATRSITATGDEVANSIKVKSDEFNVNAQTKTDEYNANAATVEKGIDDKIAEFNNDLATNNFVNNEQLDTKVNGLNWQKYKLTNDDGSGIYISIGNDLEKLRSLGPGRYYCTSVPITGASGTAGFVDTEMRDGTVKRITFRPYNSTQEYVMRYYNSWSDWERTTPLTSDTGWVSFMLVNGAISNNAYTAEGDNGFICAYRVKKENQTTKVIIRLNGSSLEYGQVIANLPQGLTDKAQSWLVRVPTDKGVGIITLRPNGEMKFYTQRDYQDKWTKDELSYIYGQYEFTL